MEYSLALKLKEAGFPFRKIPPNYFAQGIPARSFIFERIIPTTTNDKGEVIVEGYAPDLWFEPTLSELIQACGNRFHAVEKKYPEQITNGMVAEIEGGNWLAYSNEPNDLGIKAHIFKQGKTPEEAVAQLYISLSNKKHD